MDPSQGSSNSATVVPSQDSHSTTGRQLLLLILKEGLHRLYKLAVRVLQVLLRVALAGARSGSLQLLTLLQHLPPALSCLVQAIAQSRIGKALLAVAAAVFFWQTTVGGKLPEATIATDISLLFGFFRLQSTIHVAVGRQDPASPPCSSDGRRIAADASSSACTASRPADATHVGTSPCNAHCTCGTMRLPQAHPSSGSLAGQTADEALSCADPCNSSYRTAASVHDQTAQQQQRGAASISIEACSGPSCCPEGAASAVHSGVGDASSGHQCMASGRITAQHLHRPRNTATALLAHHGHHHPPASSTSHPSLSSMLAEGLLLYDCRRALSGPADEGRFCGAGSRAGGEGGGGRGGHAYAIEAMPGLGHLVEEEVAASMGWRDADDLTCSPDATAQIHHFLRTREPSPTTLCPAFQFYSPKQLMDVGDVASDTDASDGAETPTKAGRQLPSCHDGRLAAGLMPTFLPQAPFEQYSELGRAAS